MHRYLYAATILIVAFIANCANTNVEKQYLILKNGERYPLWFEKNISADYKKIIIDDLHLIMQDVDKLEVAEKQIQRNANDRITMMKYLKYKGRVRLPFEFGQSTFSMHNLFGEVVDIKGENHILISRKLIDKYKEIYDKKDIYIEMYKDIKQKVAFLNSLKTMKNDEMPDLYELFWQDDGISKNDSTSEKKEEIKNIYGKFKYYVLPIFEIEYGLETRGYLKDRYVTGIRIRVVGGKYSDGWLPMIWDDGKWKIAPGISE